MHANLPSLGLPPTQSHCRMAFSCSAGSVFISREGPSLEMSKPTSGEIGPCSPQSRMGLALAAPPHSQGSCHGHPAPCPSSNIYGDIDLSLYDSQAFLHPVCFSASSFSRSGFPTPSSDTWFFLSPAHFHCPFYSLSTPHNAPLSLLLMESFVGALTTPVTLSGFAP